MNAMAAGPASAEAAGTNSALLGWLAAALFGTALIAAAGYWGYLDGLQAPSNPAANSTTGTLSTGPAATGLAARVPAGGASVPASRLTFDSNSPATVQAAPKSPTSAGASGSAALRWPLWEFQLRQPIPPRTPPLTPPSWRMIGATQSAGVWSIIIMRQGQTAPEYFKVGETLPGGYRIDAITEEDVTLVHRGRPLILSYIGSR